MTDLLPRWPDRQPDYANLFNPAFVGLVLRAACEGYADKCPAEGGLPFALSFIAVPLALHPDVRRERPRTMRTRLGLWLDERPGLKAAFAASARALVPIVRESIIVMLRTGLIGTNGISLWSAGALVHPGSQSTDVEAPTIKTHLSHAAFVGRWLAASGSVTAVFEATGTKP